MDKRAKTNIDYDDENRLTLRGRTPDEVDGYLLSGEPDDLSYDYFED